MKVLCGRPTQEDIQNRRFLPDHDRTTLKVGLEHVCQIKDGVGACGEEFYEPDGSNCRWCVQVVERD